MEKFAITKKVLSYWRVGKVLKYVIVITLLAANFEVYICYSNEEQYEIKTIFEGSMVTLSYLITTLWLILYNSTLTNIRNRYFSAAAIVVRWASSIWLSFQVREVNPGAKWSFALNAILLQSFWNAFLTVPASMTFAKCVPHSVEGIMMGLLTSIIKFNEEIMMRLLALCFLINSGVTKENYDELGTRMNWSCCIQLLGVTLAKFIFERHEFDYLHSTLERIPKMSKEELENLNMKDHDQFNKKRREDKMKRKKSSKIFTKKDNEENNEKLPDPAPIP